MDAPLLETVPNFSEGSDDATIAAIGAAFEDAGALLADVHRDADHHRSVFTAFGTPEVLLRALEQAVGVAVEHIDLARHEGVHPRVGACDVLPIVPLADVVAGGGTMRDAVALANHVAAHLASAFELPALLYGAAAAEGDGGDAPAFAGAWRSGGLGALAARLAAGDVRPYAGPATLHPTAGAILVGARPVLVAFNVVLDTGDLEFARTLATRVRERAGGLPGVRALGLPLASRGLVQVSTNVERWRDTSPAQLLEAVRVAAAREDVGVRECELVGLAPAAVLDDLRATGVPLVAAAEPSLEHHAAAARAM